MKQRTDYCPDCGAKRLELVVAPGRFFCSTCELAGAGPCEEQIAGAQIELELETAGP